MRVQQWLIAKVVWILGATSERPINQNRKKKFFFVTRTLHHLKNPILQFKHEFEIGIDYFLLIGFKIKSALGMMNIRIIVFYIQTFSKCFKK